MKDPCLADFYIYWHATVNWPGFWQRQENLGATFVGLYLLPAWSRNKFFLQGISKAVSCPRLSSWDAFSHLKTDNSSVKFYQSFFVSPWS